MRKRYYVEQYGCVWSMSATQFEQFLETGASGSEWNLDTFGKRLRGPAKYGEFPASRYFIRSTHSILSLPDRCHRTCTIHPLDWTKDDFVEALEQWRTSGTVNV